LSSPLGLARLLRPEPPPRALELQNIAHVGFTEADKIYNWRYMKAEIESEVWLLLVLLLVLLVLLLDADTP